MKKICKSFICLLLILGQLVFITGCSKKEDNKDDKVTVLSATSFSYFDTVSKIFTYANDGKETFQKNCSEIDKLLNEYHQLFDIYYEYSGVTNLCTINKNAGGEPLVVDQKLIDFLLYCKDIYTLTNGETNPMLGSVLKLWHDARTLASTNPEAAYVPSMDDLQAAYEHTSIDLLEINDEDNTVRITDKDARIDVGALGKGYATEKAAQLLIKKNVSSYVLNIGGNIRIIGTKLDGKGWITGITDPHNSNNYALYTELSNTSCVTSGDYERYFTVDNIRYHHIIDKDTLMPANYFSSVTIITQDSGLADALSTSLFTMDYESGLALINSLDNVEAFWIEKDGTQHLSDGIVPIKR